MYIKYALFLKKYQSYLKKVVFKKGVQGTCQRNTFPRGTMKTRRKIPVTTMNCEVHQLARRGRGKGLKLEAISTEVRNRLDQGIGMREPYKHHRHVTRFCSSADLRVI
jgi:hypothetical protein